MVMRTVACGAMLAGDRRGSEEVSDELGQIRRVDAVACVDTFCPVKSPVGLTTIASRQPAGKCRLRVLKRPIDRRCAVLAPQKACSSPAILGALSPSYGRCPRKGFRGRTADLRPASPRRAAARKALSTRGSRRRATSRLASARSIRVVAGKIFELGNWPMATHPSDGVLRTVRCATGCSAPVGWRDANDD